MERGRSVSRTMLSPPTEQPPSQSPSSLTRVQELLATPPLSEAPAPLEQGLPIADISGSQNVPSGARINYSSQLLVDPVESQEHILDRNRIEEPYGESTGEGVNPQSEHRGGAEGTSPFHLLYFPLLIVRRLHRRQPSISVGVPGDIPRVHTRW